MLDFFYRDTDAEPSYEALLREKNVAVSEVWSLVQNEAECDFEDADTDKMMRLLKELGELREDREELLECIDRRDAMRRCRDGF